MALHIWAKDIEEAIKVANERRIAMIADERWTGIYAVDHARWKEYYVALQREEK